VQLKQKRFERLYTFQKELSFAFHGEAVARFDSGSISGNKTPGNHLDPDAPIFGKGVTNALAPSEA